MKYKTFTSEFKVVCLREMPMADDMALMDSPDKAAGYFNTHIAAHDHFKPDAECLVVLLLNVRCRVKGHEFVSQGIADTLLAHPREVFRAAIVAAACGIILIHNHPSGDPTPSEADIKVTRDMIRAGQLLKIDLKDHIIVGSGGTHRSLRELGYFYS